MEFVSFGFGDVPQNRLSCMDLAMALEVDSVELGILSDAECAFSWGRAHAFYGKISIRSGRGLGRPWLNHGKIKAEAKSQGIK